MRSNGWKLPFNLALGIHIMVLLGAMYLPEIFKAKPKFADIYTVSLVNISEPVQTAQPAKVQEPSPHKAAPPKIKQPVPEKAVPVEETPKEEAPKEVEKIEPAPPKAVSLKPLKQKKVKEIKESEPPPKKTAIDRKEIQKLAEALREEEILTEKARIAREALEQERQILAESIKSLNAARQPSTAAEQQSGAAAASGGSTSLIESQYHAAIFSRLQQFWSLPEYMQKDQSLTAVVVITIQQDGEVANMVFESKSGDRVFDQFVSKTIAAANPLPPIPPAMKKQRYEIGLRFKPDSIQ
jgi:TonB family protein